MKDLTTQRPWARSVRHATDGFTTALTAPPGISDFRNVSRKRNRSRIVDHEVAAVPLTALSPVHAIISISRRHMRLELADHPLDYWMTPDLLPSPTIEVVVQHPIKFRNLALDDIL